MFFSPLFCTKADPCQAQPLGLGIKGNVTFTHCGSLLQGQQPRVTPGVGDCRWNLHQATTCMKVPKSPVEGSQCQKREQWVKSRGMEMATLAHLGHRTKNHQFLQFLRLRLQFSKCFGPALRTTHGITETQNGLGWKGLENSSHFNPLNTSLGCSKLRPAWPWALPGSKTTPELPWSSFAATRGAPTPVTVARGAGRTWVLQG